MIRWIPALLGSSTVGAQWLEQPRVLQVVGIADPLRIGLDRLALAGLNPPFTDVLTQRGAVARTAPEEQRT